MPQRCVVAAVRAMRSSSAFNARELGAQLTAVEHGSPEAGAILAGLPSARQAHVIGITGAPGVGKSTTSNALIRAWRLSGRTVGVLAVDPSSPITGGALLGDRIRMTDHALDDGVFIRSLATRGHLGGLSQSVPDSVRVLDAAGFDIVLVETVGVGQSEVDIMRVADTCVIVMAPGMGDAIQAAKAGLIEIGDVYVVNKADRPGAEKTARDLRGAAGGRPVLTISALSGKGIDELVAAIDAHSSQGARSATQ